MARVIILNQPVFLATYNRRVEEDSTVRHYATCLGDMQSGSA